MEWSWIKSLLLLMSSGLGFFNKFSKETLLSSSFDSFRSLNVYMSLPRHFTCLFFILLLVMAVCRAQGRVWRIRHTCITWIAKSKTGSKEKKQVIQSDQDVHVHGLWCMEWKLLLYDLSPYINSFESMAIFFFFFFSWTFMCPHFFLFFNTWTFMCPFFFLDSPCLSLF